MVEVINFYLNNLMSNHKSYNISPILIPQNIIDNYNLMYNHINGFLCVRVEKGMYGLIQEGIISHMTLKEHLHPFIFKHAKITPGLWSHNNDGIKFTLMVNNF